MVTIHYRYSGFSDALGARSVPFLWRPPLPTVLKSLLDCSRVCISECAAEGIDALLLTPTQITSYNDTESYGPFYSLLSPKSQALYGTPVDARLS